MSDVTVTVTEIVDGVSVESTPTTITVFDGVFVNSGGGGGTGGAVDSVNGHTGTVVLSASDVSAQPADSDLTAIAALTTTTFGRALLALADAAALRTSAGLGTAATQATSAFDAAGAAATAQAASQPVDSDLTAIAALTTTSFGRSLLTQADAAAARTTLGAGTSSLALGTSSSTAKAGDYQPTAANISDATTIGRTVLTAADAAAVRTAIGAGTSSLALGTTGSTAAAGNDARLSDSRTPTAHASSHAAAGSDPASLDDSQVAPVTPNNQTGTTYTFVLADKHRLVAGSNASAQTYTIPPNSSVAYPVGATLQVAQKGAGQITLAAGAGVTIRTPHGAKVSAQYGIAAATQVVADEWYIGGDVTS